jgi:hypothetical protein
MHTSVIFVRTLRLLALAGALTGACSAGYADTLISGAHDGNASGDGFEVTSADVNRVDAAASFSSNAFNGLSDSLASLSVDGGRFEHNGNVGLQAILDPGSTVTIDGGSFSSNSAAGADIRGATFLVNAGQFNDNGAYGLSVQSDGFIQGGSFSGNASFGVIAFGGTTFVYNGSFSGNSTDFGTTGGATLIIFGTFDTSGLLQGSGTFSGRLADAAQSQVFTYATFGDSLIILSTVPEPDGLALLAAGLLTVVTAFTMSRSASLCRRKQKTGAQGTRSLHADGSPSAPTSHGSAQGA